jgi:hypothetical protein
MILTQIAGNSSAQAARVESATFGFRLRRSIAGSQRGYGLPCTCRVEARRPESAANAHGPPCGLSERSQRPVGRVTNP